MLANNQNMKYIIAITCANILFCSYGQSTSPEVISSARNHFENGSAQVSWALGEPITETVSNGTNELYQGFHQTRLSWASIFEESESTCSHISR